MSAAAVRLLVLDVDGVLTDGSIIYDDAGRELKSFFVRDGLAIKRSSALRATGGSNDGVGVGFVPTRAVA